MGHSSFSSQSSISVRTGRHAPSANSFYDACRKLAEVLEDYGTARIVVLVDEIATAKSFLGQIAAPDVGDDHPDLEMTPRTLGPGIYGLQM